MPRQFTIIAKAVLLATPITVFVAWKLSIGGSDEEARAFAVSVLGAVFDAFSFVAAMFGSRAERLVTDVEQLALTKHLVLTAASLSWLNIVLALLVDINRRRAIEWIWPISPQVIEPVHRHSIFRRQPQDALNPKNNLNPLIGRQKELETLLKFASSRSSQLVRVMSLEGGEGYGKSRLAHEWLSSLADHGWDAGYALSDLDTNQARQVRLRKNTAIVFDNVWRTYPDQSVLWSVILSMRSSNKRLRILLVDQFVPRPEASLEVDQRKKIETVWPNDAVLRLLPLTDESARTLAPELSEHARKEANGRPLLLMLGEDPYGELKRRAHIRLKLAEQIGGSATNTLVLSTIAAPIAYQKIALSKPIETGSSKLRHLFEGKPTFELRRFLPPVEPDALANRILLAWSSDQPVDLLRSFATEAVLLNASSAEHRIVSLWRETLSGTDLEVRAMWTECFNLSYPEHVHLIQKRAQTVIASVTVPAAQSSESYNDNGKTKITVQELRELEVLSNGWPDDVTLATAEMMGIKDVAHAFGISGKLEEMNLLLQRQIIKAQKFGTDAECQGRLGLMLACCIKHYAEQLEFENSESLADILFALYEVNPRNYLVGEAILTASQGLVTEYGKNRRFEESRNWIEHAFNAAKAYPESAYFAFLKCGSLVNQLHTLMSEPAAEEAMDLLSRLETLLEAFPNDEKIMIRVLRGVKNAVVIFGRAGATQQLEKWVEFGSRVSLRFPESKAVQLEYMGMLQNAIILSVQNVQDMRIESMLRDAIRVAENFCNDADIAAVDANISRAASRYWGAQDGQFEKRQYWRRRVADCAKRFPYDAKIQHLAWIEGISLENRIAISVQGS